MTHIRSLIAIAALTACISRGSGPQTPTQDAAPVDDMTTPPPGDAGGDARPPPGDRPMCSPTRQDEDTPGRCRDGLDNDCNGFADCDDFNCRNCENPQCLMNNMVSLGRDAGMCTCMVPQENTTALCSDGLDNDCDGFSDCQDFSCQTCGVPVCLQDGGLNRGDAGFCVCRGPENTNAACMDGVDNDCNGFTDCRDFSCSRPDGGAMVNVCDSGTSTDASVDGGRCDSSSPENTAEACRDGIDNDCDGFMDCRDRDCSCVGTCGPNVQGCTCMGPEDNNAACTDGRDNDCDSFIDCAGSGAARADFGCSMNPAVTACPRDGGRD